MEGGSEAAGGPEGGGDHHNEFVKFVNSIANQKSGTKIDKNNIDLLAKLVSSLDASEDSTQYENVMRTLQDNITTLVSECIAISDSKKLIEKDYEQMVREYHAEQRNFESLQTLHKEKVQNLLEKIANVEVECEEKLRNSNRDKERLIGQIELLKGELRTFKEQLRSRGFDMMKLTAELDKAKKEMKAQVVANKNVEHENPQETSAIDQVEEMKKVFQAKLVEAQKVDSEVKLKIKNLEKSIENLQRSNCRLQEEKKQLMVKLYNFETMRAQSTTSPSLQESKEIGITNVLIQTLKDENSRLQSSEVAYQNELGKAHQTIKILFERTKRVNEMEEEMFQLRAAYLNQRKLTNPDASTQNQGEGSVDVFENTTSSQLEPPQLVVAKPTEDSSSSIHEKASEKDSCNNDSCPDREKTHENAKASLMEHAQSQNISKEAESVQNTFASGLSHDISRTNSPLTMKDTSETRSSLQKQNSDVVRSQHMMMSGEGFLNRNSPLTIRDSFMMAPGRQNSFDSGSNVANLGMVRQSEQTITSHPASRSNLENEIYQSYLRSSHSPIPQIRDSRINRMSIPVSGSFPHQTRTSSNFGDKSQHPSMARQNLSQNPDYLFASQLQRNLASHVPRPQWTHSSQCREYTTASNLLRLPGQGSANLHQVPQNWTGPRMTHTSMRNTALYQATILNMMAAQSGNPNCLPPHKSQFQTKSLPPPGYDSLQRVNLQTNYSSAPNRAENSSPKYQDQSRPNSESLPVFSDQASFRPIANDIGNSTSVQSCKVASDSQSGGINQLHYNQRECSTLGTNQPLYNPIHSSKQSHLSKSTQGLDQQYNPNQSRFGPNQLDIVGNQFQEGPRQFTKSANQFADGPTQFKENTNQFTDGPNLFTESASEFNDNPNQFTEGANQFADPNQFTEGANQFADSNQFTEGANQLAGPNQFTEGANQFADPNQFTEGANQFADPNQFTEGANQLAGPNQFAEATNQFADPNQFTEGTNQFAEPNQFAKGANQFAEPNLFAKGANQFADDQYQFSNPNTSGSSANYLASGPNQFTETPN